MYRWVVAALLAFIVVLALGWTVSSLRWDEDRIANLIGAMMVERELAWVESADATLLARADSESGDYRFYEICWITCDPVGIGIVAAQRCFPAARMDRIEGTSDVILSDEHLRLQLIATDFAAQYNLSMVEAMKADGHTSCDPNADSQELLTN